MTKKEPLTLADGTTALYVAPHERSLDYTVGNAESLRAATDRTMQRLAEMALATPEGGTTVVGGHGITTRLAVNAIMNLAGPGILPTKMDYGAETVIEIDGNDWHVPYAGLPTDVPNAGLERAIWRAE